MNHGTRVEQPEGYSGSVTRDELLRCWEHVRKSIDAPDFGSVVDFLHSFESFGFRVRRDSLFR